MNYKEYVLEKGTVRIFDGARTPEQRKEVVRNDPATKRLWKEKARAEIGASGGGPVRGGVCTRGNVCSG